MNSWKAPLQQLDYMNDANSAQDHAEGVRHRQYTTYMYNVYVHAGLHVLWKQTCPYCCVLCTRERLLTTTMTPGPPVPLKVCIYNKCTLGNMEMCNVEVSFHAHMYMCILSVNLQLIHVHVHVHVHLHVDNSILLLSPFLRLSLLSLFL